MILETHGETTERTAELISAYVDTFAARPLVVCAFRDDSAILMNAEFKRFSSATSELMREIEGVL